MGKIQNYVSLAGPDQFVWGEKHAQGTERQGSGGGGKTGASATIATELWVVLTHSERFAQSPEFSPKYFS